jgi:uridine kinase
VHKQSPFTIGITGGSGSGKTFFIKELSAHFRPEEICLLSQDHYYRPREEQVIDALGVKNFDLPGAIEKDRLAADIAMLKRGETLFKTEYTFNNPKALPRVLEFRPAPILIIEGLFVQYFPDVEKALDLKIFIEARDEVKLRRRIKRDNEERGYDMEDVVYRYEHHVLPIYRSLIEPLKHSADLIIPNNDHFEHALRIIVLALKGHLREVGV